MASTSEYETPSSLLSTEVATPITETTPETIVTSRSATGSEELSSIPTRGFSTAANLQTEITTLKVGRPEGRYCKTF